MALLSLKNVSLSYGGLPLLDDVEFHIERGDRICLLGANGTGKSSMLRVLAGESNPDSGEIIRASGVRVARLPQQVPVHLRGRVQEIVCPEADTDSDAALEACQILSRLQLDPMADFETLSGGTRRRVLLACTLLGGPDVVLLDEPTNHLDIDSILWLENFLIRHCRTFLFVTHDRAFLRKVASRVVELDRGRLSDWNCDYDTFLRRKEEHLQGEARQWAELDRKLEKEEAWRRRGVKARTTRNEGRVRALEALRDERRARRERTGTVQMSIQESARTGQTVLKAQQLSFGYDRRPLIRNFNTVLTRGDKVGILGPNGCGKTTLLRLLLEPSGGELTPTSGRVIHGTNWQIAYSDQLRAQLNDNESLAENVAEGREFVLVGGVRRHIYGYLEDFLFSPDRARQPVRSLSGGERNRLLMAKLFAQPSNVLVLDEPTNDLDYDTLELLEDQLVSYAGTVLLVSHDRAFLNNVVTGVLVFEKHDAARPDSWLGPEEGWYVNEYVGGYDEWASRRLFPPVPAETKPVVLPRVKTPGRRKLAERERRELESLPGRIEALESEQERLQADMADPAFYKRDSAEIAKEKQRSAQVVTELENAYARWQELERVVHA
jgi:ATP-binding cassette subfamily F protein uup